MISTEPKSSQTGPEKAEYNMIPTVTKPVLAICLPATQVLTSPSALSKPQRKCTICKFKKDLKEFIRKGHVVHTSIAKY
jgi:hypothetical protein